MPDIFFCGEYVFERVCANLPPKWLLELTVSVGDLRGLIEFMFRFLEILIDFMSSHATQYGSHPDRRESQVGKS